jgi:hypothetical protein
MEIAIWHEGLESIAVWVLHIDAASERLLLANPEGAFYWKAINECKFVKAATPDVPRPVVAIQMQPQNNGVFIARPNGLHGLN